MNRDRCLFTGLLVWFLLVVVSLTWVPFGFGEVANAPRLIGRSSLFDVVGNVVLMLPIGMIVGSLAAKRPVRQALVVAFLLSACIEVGQLFLAARVASALDTILNAAGAGLGAAVARRLRTPTSTLGVLLITASATYLGALFLVADASSRFRDGMKLAGWEPEYEIAAGNEVGVDRAYLGQVSDAYLCAGDESGKVCARPGADVTERKRLVAEAEASQRVEIGAQVISASDAQRGPARIVTFSQGALLRNVTLAQVRTDLVLRIRTPLLGPDGSRFELVLPDVVHAGHPTRVVLVHDRETVTFRVAGSDGERTAKARFDGLAAGILWREEGTITVTQLVAARRWTASLLALPVVFAAVCITAAALRKRGAAVVRA